MGWLMLCGLALLALGMAGWLAGRRQARRARLRLGQYPAPKRRGVSYGDGLDGFINRGDDNI